MSPTDPRNPFDLPEFRQELSAMFDEKLKPTLALLEKHDAKIETHEAALNRAKGARWAFLTGWTILSVLFEWFMHGTGHKP